MRLKEATQMTTTLKAAPPELWGRRVQRCRKQVISSTEAIEDLTDGYITSSTLGRIEALAEPPTRRAARQKATVVLVMCGYDPEDFGLSLADLPSLFTVEQLLDLRVRAFGWMSELAAA